MNLTGAVLVGESCASSITSVLVLTPLTYAKPGSALSPPEPYRALGLLVEL
jgi:hypothetical protein